MHSQTKLDILHVNTHEQEGGAAIAAHRLHLSLLRETVKSRLLVQVKNSDDPTVLTSTSGFKAQIQKLRPTLDKFFYKFYKNKKDKLFSPALLPFSHIVKEINRLNPDVVHLHWIGHAMLSINDLSKINAPIVWTLHDNWAFTGGCHVFSDCTNYKLSCGRCPQLGSETENDLSRKIFKRKKHVFSSIKKLRIVGVSRWMADCARSSSLLRNANIINLPNGLNTDIFSPFDRGQSRALWRLPQGKKIILFGANTAISDKNKGFAQLCSALHKLKQEEVELVIFGSSTPENPPLFHFKTHYLGHVHDNVSLRTIYSAADVMIVPSLQEAFGQTASESMACGTPVVAFAYSGLLDIVDHKENGYLAKPYDTQDLAQGIEWVLENKEYKALCINAREKVLREFDSKRIAKKYIQLYKEVLNE